MFISSDDKEYQTNKESLHNYKKYEEKLAKAHINNIFYEWSNTVFERAIMGDMYEDKSAMFLKQNAGYERIVNIGSIISRFSSSNSTIICGNSTCAFSLISKRGGILSSIVPSVARTSGLTPFL